MDHVCGALLAGWSFGHSKSAKHKATYQEVCPHEQSKEQAPADNYRWHAQMGRIAKS